MSTMTLIDDYVDALLDGSGLDHRTGHNGMGHDDMGHDGMGHDGRVHGAIRIEDMQSDHMPDDGMRHGGMGPDAPAHDSLRLPASDNDARARPAQGDTTDDDRPAASATVLSLLRVDADAGVSAPPPVAECRGDAVSRQAPTPAPMPAPAPARAAPFMPAFVPDTPPVAAGATIHEPPVSALATPRRWIRVTVGQDSYALELLRVQEVVRLAPIVALRGAARAVLGVMNLRGRIVPVVDLGLWLASGCVHGDERSRIVVVERDDEMIGVLVSTVEDVVTLGRERIEPPLASSDPGAIVGIARVGAAPTVLLDAIALFG